MNFWPPPPVISLKIKSYRFVSSYITFWKLTKSFKNLNIDWFRFYIWLLALLLKHNLEANSASINGGPCSQSTKSWIASCRVSAVHAGITVEWSIPYFGQIRVHPLPIVIAVEVSTIFVIIIVLFFFFSVPFTFLLEWGLLKLWNFAQILGKQFGEHPAPGVNF